MEEKLIKEFHKHFKSLNKKIKDEEVLFFLDSQRKDKFNRETYTELTERMEDRDLKLTPLNFARTYY